MHVILPKYLEEYVKFLVKSGVFNSEQDVIRDALKKQQEFKKKEPLKY